MMVSGQADFTPGSSLCPLAESSESTAFTWELRSLTTYRAFIAPAEHPQGKKATIRSDYPSKGIGDPSKPVSGCLP